jgi:hypothetical protein
VKSERNHHCYVFNFLPFYRVIRATRPGFVDAGDGGLIIAQRPWGLRGDRFLHLPRTFPSMDRLYELESMRCSIAMLNPRASALDREEAMALLQELQDVERKLRDLRNGL